jgi:hypothetical protein
MLLKLSQSLPLNTVTGTKEITEEKTKASSQKGPVLHKGRFSVTSDDVDLKVSISLDNTCCCGDVTHCRWCVECVVREFDLVTWASSLLGGLLPSQISTQ